MAADTENIKSKGLNMIEKLERYIREEDGIKISCPPDNVHIIAKINELIDAVNAIQKEREAERFEIQEWIGILEAVRKSVNIHEKQIDELQMKDEELAERINYTLAKATDDKEALKLLDEKYKPVDKFAEQRKWIGKLCWFGDGDDFDEVGYLTEIDPDMPEAKFRCDCHDYYEKCKPVKPTDSIIYKGGDNE